MGTGYLEDSDLIRILRLVKNVGGDVAEVGVFKASLFHRLATWAHRYGVMAHAFDSFQGMAKPGPYDLEEKYPEGKLSVGGVKGFVHIMEEFSIPLDWYILWPGFIPDCFIDTEKLRFRFVYIDLDHYQPTIEAIEWVLGRLLPGAVLGFDDWFPSTTIGPSKAIRTLIGWDIIPPWYENDNNQIFFRRRDEQ